MAACGDRKCWSDEQTAGIIGSAFNVIDQLNSKLKWLDDYFSRRPDP